MSQSVQPFPQIFVDTEFEMVIGLEVHVQLATESKQFSNAPSKPKNGMSVSDLEPNFQANVVCAGHPGTLPVLNQRAVMLAVQAGLATNCKINSPNLFSRKHYFYPDLPKGYQISQLELPLCEYGYLDIELNEEGTAQKRIGITRIHMEEDAGKSTHRAGMSLVNLNRAGTPLIEVVSEPDLRSPLEAGAYLRKLYGIVTTLGVCDGNLQEGNFRCDANVSIRPKGFPHFGTRTEIKNINSFRFVEKAIEYEAERQRQVLLSGGRVVQETRLYDSQKNQTHSMRTKEEAEDYRYLPDPDLPPLILESRILEQLRKNLPELPDQKRDRYLKDFEIGRLEATLISGSQDWSSFFESACQGLDKKGARVLTSLMTGEASRLLSEENLMFSQSQFLPTQFQNLSQAVVRNEISITAAKQVVASLFKEGGNALEWIDRLGLRQVNDLSALEPLIVQVIAANPKQVDEYRSGKEKVLGFFVGQVMKQSGGKANPGLLQEFIVKKLKGE